MHYAPPMLNILPLLKNAGGCIIIYACRRHWTVFTGLPRCGGYISQVDTKNEVLEWYEQGGGPVATALVALSRLGIPCKFYGIIGDDHAGETIEQSLIKEGIDVSGLIKKRERNLSACIHRNRKRNCKKNNILEKTIWETLTAKRVKG